MTRFGTDVAKLWKNRGLYYICPSWRGKPSKKTRVVAVTHDKDYWIIEGNLATRVHVRPRLQKYTPSDKTTYPGTDNINDPWLYRLGEGRTTKVKYTDATDYIAVEDNWQHANANEALPEKWTGRTEFYYGPEKP